MPGKPMGGKTVTASAPGKKPNALQQPLKSSKELGEVGGAGPLPRGEVVRRVWA